MAQTTAAAPDPAPRPAAPAQLDAAADNIGRVRPRGNVEQQPGEDEQPEFVNAERLNHHLTGSLTLPASFARVPNLRRSQFQTDCSTIMIKSGFHQIAHIL